MGTAWSAMGRPDPAGPSTSASNQDAGPSEEACDKDEDMEGGEAGARAEGESEDHDAGSSHVAEGESTHDAGPKALDGVFRCSTLAQAPPSLF